MAQTLDVSGATLVGQSLGGCSVLPVAARHPERVAAVMMADTIIGVGAEDRLVPPSVVRNAEVGRLLADAFT